MHGAKREFKRFARFFLKCFVLIAAAGGARTSASEQSLQLAITRPRPHAVLSQPYIVFVEAKLDRTFDLDVVKAFSAKVVAVGEGSEIPIATGDLRSPDAANHIRALWELKGVPAGEYVIKISIDVDGQHPEASVPIRVHAAPVLELSASPSSAKGWPLRVTFKAKVTTSDSAEIDHFMWTPSDGRRPVRTKQPVFTHDYSKPGQYIVWVESIDTLGGHTLLARDLKLNGDYQQQRQGRGIDRILLFETNDCGCKDLRIRSAPGGTSRIYCDHGNDIPDTPNCKEVNAPGACAANEKAFTCTLGRIAPTSVPAGPKETQFGWGFEVVADLTDNTNNVNSCSEGQFVRSTRKRDGETRKNGKTLPTPPARPYVFPGEPGNPPLRITPLGPPSPIPPTGSSDYSTDGYGAESFVKKHLPNQITWTDFPQDVRGFRSSTQDDEFIAFVQGNQGTCWCHFLIVQSWTANEGASGHGLIPAGGVNCSYVLQWH